MAKNAPGAGAPLRIVLPAVLAAAVAVLAWVLLWRSPEEFVRRMDHGRLLFDDFVLRFHPVARDFLRTRAPYPGYYYSPTFAVLLAPFGALPLRAALVAWGVVQVGCSVALLLVPAGWLARRSRWLLAGYVLVFLTSLPLLHNFKWGQVSVPLTLCVIGSLFLARAGRRLASAALLALAVSVKFYPGIYVLWFVLRRDVRYLAAFAVSFVLLGVVVPAAVLGPGDTIGFYRSVSANLRSDQPKIAGGVNSQYLPHVIERWTHLARGDSAPLAPEGSPIRGALRIAAGGIFVLALAFLARHRHEPDPLRAFAVLSASIPLVVPTSWPHYFVFLPFFQAWAAWRILSTPRARVPAVLLLGVSVLGTGLPAMVAAGSWRTYAYSGLPLVASMAVLALALLPADDRRPGADPAPAEREPRSGDGLLQ